MTQALCVALALLSPPAPQHGVPDSDEYAPDVREASDEGAQAMASMELVDGVEVALWAAEPHLANPVVFTMDTQLRAWVCETFRLHAGVTDIRSHMDWLDEDLAARTVEDRLAMMRAHAGDAYEASYATEHERLRVVEDTDGDGIADRSTVYADGFRFPQDGIAAGVLVRGDDVYYTCIPSLWKLRDTDGDLRADERVELSSGYGVNVSLLGHDLHGLIRGHDGRIWFSIGDRGYNIEHEGRRLAAPKTGAVFRCQPDGSELEVFATGLRNPQELAFDDYGNLFTGDNNSDGGDQARFVYVMKGSDSGWRYPYQWITRPNLRGPWNAERMWHPRNEGQPAFLLPPLRNVASGPSGLAFDPGTGLPEAYRDSFFLCDFRGDADYSGILSFRVEPDGAGFEVVDLEHFVWNSLATDCEIGVDGALYVSDWVHGWGMTGKGRIYRVSDVDGPGEVEREVERILRAGFAHRQVDELGALLASPDRRVRLEAQWELATRGFEGIAALNYVFVHSDDRLARLHALWGLGQVAGEQVEAAATLVAALDDADAEVRVQAARGLVEIGDAGARSRATAPLIAGLSDGSARVRAAFAEALGDLGASAAVDPLFDVLDENDDQDPYLRHAVVHALERVADADAVLARADDPRASSRLGALLVLRRWEHAGAAVLLDDADPFVVAEAARAIYDVPIADALPALARKLGELDGADDRYLVRRALNANELVGDAAALERVLRVARSGDFEGVVRREALEILRDWPEPGARDRVHNFWRPLDPRETPGYSEGVAALVRDGLGTALEDEVRLALVELAARRAPDTAEPGLARIALDPDASRPVRQRALRELAALDSAELAGVLPRLLGDPDEEVAGVALELVDRLDRDEAVGHLTRAVESGGVAVRRGALRAVGRFDPAIGTALVGTLLDELERGTLQPELGLELDEAIVALAEPALVERYGRHVMANLHDTLGSRHILLHGGDAARGRELFFTHAEAQCLRCHSMEGQGGSEAGPDLTGVGARGTREYLLESLLYPSNQIAEGFSNEIVFLTDGTSLAGRILEETDAYVAVETKDDGIWEIPHDEIEQRREDVSAMPANLDEVLEPAELRDLVEFLAGLDAP